MFKVYAQCDLSQQNLNLADCYTAGIGSGRTVQEMFSNPTQLINLGVNTIFAVSGLILLVLLMYAGYLYIYDTAKGKEQAKEILTTALKGFVLMFSAYWIVQIIIALTGVNSLI
jgi:RsiW-degrading membrane proteinase PrsW (M82 family)